MTSFGIYPIATTPFLNKREIDFSSISEKFRIPVLACGNGWLVVDKPAGLTVHNTPGQDLCTLLSGAIQRDPSLSGQIAMDPNFGIHPVHRLDKETSGTVLLAACRERFRFFSHQFESGQVTKRYIAILHGRLEQPEESLLWRAWTWPLSEGAGGRNNPRGAHGRKPCETRYRVMDHSTHYTWVEMELLTGRTHQIRRHAKLAGHPIVGDSRYGSARAIAFLRQHHGFDRLALHAHALTLRLPDDNSPTRLETRFLPDKIRILFQNDLPSSGVV